AASGERLMANGLAPVVRFLHGLANQADADLLHRFITRRDEHAFAALVQRHGPMVFGVCRRFLPHQDAEDAFQATFLVLARKARSIRRPELLGHWLYGVACRIARKARAQTRRANQVSPVDQVVEGGTPAFIWADLRPVLDDEISRLPQRYRIPFVLC